MCRFITLMVFFFQAEDGIRYLVRSRGLGDVYKRQDFNRLVEEHGPALYRMAYRMIGDQHEAEDMVQELSLIHI